MTPAGAIEFTRVEKILYPKTRFTKGDVIKYYLEIAPVLLPHFQQRPVTLKRYPDGIQGQFFYEKDAPGYTPAWVPTFPVPRRDGGEPIHYILINDAQVLAWCANIAALELHPFLHRAPAIDSPTALAFDLDPGDGADLTDCARVALELRDLLLELHLECWPKVSGSKGLQVYVPLNTPTTYAQTQAFAKAIAELMHRKHPHRVVSEMAKELRRGKIFIDWSQNSDFKTTVGVYSLRAKREEPYVSAPVAWDEVIAAKRPRGALALNFSPAGTLARVAKLGDLFAPVLTQQQVLPAAFVEAINEPPAQTSRRSVRVGAASAARAPGHRSPRLDKYEAMRNFAITPEPSAAPRRSAQGSRRRFVVQKHAASHLHYDFRLEMNETLRSWAVPKGLPYSVDERHSAFATEDHPLDYLMFEGIIPQGQYGGGTVMVWDVGSYDVIDGNYWKGFLRVYLRGRKLKGEWTLTRVEEREGKARWVVAKTGDAMKPVSARRDDRSAVSRRTMAEIAAARDAVWESNRDAEGRATGPDEARDRSSSDIGRGLRNPPSRRKRSTTDSAGKSRRGRAVRGESKGSSRKPLPARERSRPEFIEPMMARGVSALPHGSEWIYEVKWDGYRALAIKYGDAVDLLSRKGNSLASDFPAVVAAIGALPVDMAVLDGEIVALDERGRPQFQLLQNRRSARDGQIVFYAYDLLQKGADDLRGLPLENRKTRLAELVRGTDIRFSADLPGQPGQILAQAHALGLEGIVAKRRDSAYESGERSGAWVKLKLSPEQEFVIGGYKPGKPLESLLVGYYRGKKLLFAGKVRQGLNPQNRVELWRALQSLLTDECPFANIPNSKTSHFGEGVTAEQMRELKWANPKLVAQVSFAEWTSSGNLRHATFLGMRNDKDPKDVVRE